MKFIRTQILSRIVVVFMALYVLVVGLISPKTMLTVITDAVNRQDIIDTEIDRLHK